jgi:sigma-B regulation protein RsbQ
MDILKRNNVKVIGKGKRTIIFAHGFGCDQNMWRFIVPHFENNFQIVLYDHVGSGQSDSTAYNSEKYKSLHGYADDLLEIYETLNLEKAIFVGHSVSAMIGALASIKRPDLFERLIMIGPSPRYLNSEPDYIGGFEKSSIIELLDMMEMNFVGWASYLAPISMKNEERPRLAEELQTSFTSSDPVITREFAEVIFFSDHREDLPMVTVPSLILQCSEDSVVPIEVGEYLHRHLKNSSFQLMEAKGHYPHLSQPEETVRLIKEYLSFTLVNPGAMWRIKKWINN